MDENYLPTEFTPGQLEELRALVLAERSKHRANDERGQKLQNLGMRLDTYCARASTALGRTGTFG